MYLALGVDIMLLKRSFAVMMSVVLVLTLPRYSTRSPQPSIGHNAGLFFRAMSTDDAEVGCTTAMWNTGDWDEDHGVSSGVCGSALGQVVDFSSIGMLPEVAI